MLKQKLLTLKDARTHVIPRRPDGRPINPSTLYRWIHRGLGGRDGKRIKLDVIYVGNTPYLTEDGIAEFCRAVTEAKLERHRRTEALAADVTDDELKAAGLR